MSREAYEELLARGYPYLRSLTPALGKGAAEAARLYADEGFHERHVPSDVALLALALPAPPDDAALAALVRRTLGTPRIEGPRFVLEAIVGTERLAPSIVDALAEARGSSLPSVDGEFRALGMMLRRLPIPERTDLTARLADASSKLSEGSARAFRIITGGFAAIAKEGQRDASGELTAYDLVFADDDPGSVAEALKKLRIDENVRPNVRLAHLGGEEGLRVFCERALEFSPRFWHLFEEDFGPLENSNVAAACARLRKAKMR